MKNPTLERGPKVSMPINEPQITITSGVRQPGADVARGVLSVAVMSFPADALLVAAANRSGVRAG
jgi:hypothetical protein